MVHSHAVYDCVKFYIQLVNGGNIEFLIIPSFYKAHGSNVFVNMNLKAIHPCYSLEISNH